MCGHWEVQYSERSPGAGREPTLITHHSVYALALRFLRGQRQTRSSRTRQREADPGGAPHTLIALSCADLGGVSRGFVRATDTRRWPR